ncbi:MAG: hypothetical protein A3F31_05075 [Candidatus Levybacteria bacterium RIFCSPHIGHO2_12_FULL_38_12]|nr:MAG: hypothetical protein A2770_00270 [Candidatus Levybacteria bacterium RIFCSPHIGHO2_01_FULL_38_12]OGH21718.1 MAG: hypothetical protein A3D75_00830 [Candidatus Levybacteria bacterium RIFCSPHIGHO2_02_FULL_37_18]OGH22624.1 MAG: hypothetical protein A3F31_05075 [Candidatus Levybacteria bacterium RIFCSPHIGHO2_12_FULL_38_12]OGH33339.1 MAG: hypothetical protein A3A47_03780 [Candidatus Levybacteria bacterium RIFCSPLOWO2_01_FULL_37_20]OGH43728.1 MAG: hypothetical protein A3J14_04330 [Candidatus Lev
MRKIKSFFYPKGQFSVFRTVLVLIFLLGFVLRIIGTNPGYPPTHPDEPVMYATSAYLVVNNTLDPFLAPTYRFQYPGLFIYLYAFLFKFIFIPLSVFTYAVLLPEEVSRNIYRMQEFVNNVVVGTGYINAMFWARYITAFVSFFSVPLTYLIGKRMFNTYVGLLAAFFVAVNYRHVLSSHFSLPDAPNATLALLVLYVSLLVYKNPTLRNYLILGISLSLSLATKLYVFSIIAFLLTHLLVLLKKKNKQPVFKRFFSLHFLLSRENKNFLYAGCLSVVIFFLLNPFLVSYLHVAKRTHQLNNLRYGLFYPPFEIIFPPLWYLYEIGFGEMMSILFLVGVLLLIVIRRYWINGIYLSLFILLPCAILFYFSHGAAYVRNFTSIVPFAIIVGALTLWTIFDKVWGFFTRNKKYYLFTLIVIACIVSYGQVVNSLKLDYFAIKPWNSTCIQQWMDENIKKGDVVAVNNLVPKSKNEGVSYVVFGNTENYKNDFTSTALQEEKIDYVVADIEYLRGRFNWWVSSSDIYWGQPVALFDNSFDGLALKELSRYIVKSCIRPWQSPGDNYIAIKIPPPVLSNDLELINDHNFMYQSLKIIKFSSLYPSFGPDEVVVIHSSDCLVDSCLKIRGKSISPARNKIVIEDRIPVVAGKRYVVKGKIRSKNEIGAESRDGFLRIDYYSSKVIYSTKRGMLASISRRYYGDGSWKEFQVSQVAPNGAAYMQVSFQVERYDKTFFLDEVKVYRIQQDPSDTEIQASNKKEIDNVVLYPLSLL